MLLENVVLILGSAALSERQEISLRNHEIDLDDWDFIMIIPGVHLDLLNFDSNYAALSFFDRVNAYQEDDLRKVYHIDEHGMIFTVIVFHH